MAASPPAGAPPRMYGQYQHFEVISAFHKELRRGDFEQASYWLQVMMTGGASMKYLASYLWSVSAEELAPSELETAMYCAAVRLNADKIFPQHLYHATALFCRAKKWWQDAEGKRVRELIATNRKEIFDGVTREFPLYVHDKHTSKGKGLIARGKADLRYEGSWRGMVWRAEAQAMVDARNERRAEEVVPDAGEATLPEPYTLDDITWDDVWGREGWAPILAHFEFLEANGM